MQIVSSGDNLHETSILISGENKKKYLKISSAESLPNKAISQKAC